MSHLKKDSIVTIKRSAVSRVPDKKLQKKLTVKAHCVRIKGRPAGAMRLPGPKRRRAKRLARFQWEEHRLLTSRRRALNHRCA